ncbi:MAG: ABC transporter ATP-binding protein [Deltaproteobacteria bacterium]|nr:ABC transporter ATP-binding protein [Deltaproteobacteria bacterium]
MSKGNSKRHIKLLLKNLCKYYQEAGGKIDILDNIDAEFYQGEVVALVGKSGTGKTTLLNLISGIDNPDSGEVWIGETLITGLSEDQLTLIRRNQVGIVFQFFNLIPTLSVIENVALPSELNRLGSNKSRLRAQQLLERVNLGDRLNSYPDVLSGGEQQRVAIARALINDPDLILADEPTGNLDDETAKEILDLLLSVAREAGKTMIIATHSLEIINYADQVYTIHNGKLFSE